MRDYPPTPVYYRPGAAQSFKVNDLARHNSWLQETLCWRGSLVIFNTSQGIAKKLNGSPIMEVA